MIEENLEKAEQIILSLINDYLEPYKSFINEFDVEQSVKDEQEVCNKLNEYQWAITGCMDRSIYNNILSVNNSEDAIKAFKDYFMSNNFKLLDHHLNVYWKKSDFIGKERLAIIEDSIKIFKEKAFSNDINIHNLIVPTMLNQIEGLRKNYLLKKGYKELPYNKWEDSKGNTKTNWKDLIKKSIPYEGIMSQSLTFILEVIFAKSHSSYNPISRHLISHGKDLNYGNIGTSLRCFIVIDFFSSLDWRKHFN